MEKYKNREWLQKELERLGSGRAISREHGVGKTTIAKWLKKFELSKAPKRVKEKKFYQNKEWLEEELRKGLSAKDISETAGVSIARIYDIFQEEEVDASNIKMESARYRNKEWLEENFSKYENITEFAKATGHDRHLLSEQLSNHDIYEHEYYSVEEDFFEIIDTEEKAYWLGFLMADSTVRKISENQYRLTFKLSSIDKESVLKFQDSVSSNSPVVDSESINTNGSTSYSSSITINNKKICTDLISHGVIPRRTGFKTIPDTIPEELISHFLRGYFDGDGSVRYQYHEKPNGTHKWIRGFSLCVGETMISPIISLLTSLGIKKEAMKLHRFKYHTEIRLYRKDEIPKIINYLYKDATIYMDRKYQIAKNYLSTE